MRSIALLAAIWLAVCTPIAANAQTFRKANGKVDHAALNRACHGVPPYSQTWGGLNSKVSAKATADAITEAVEALRPFLQSGSEVTADAKLSFVRSLVGGYGADAHLVVVENYFCRLVALYPEKKTELLAARDRVLDLFSDVYDPENSGAKAAEYAPFKARVIQQAGGTESILTSAQVAEAIGNFKFDTRLTASIVFKTTSEAVNAGVCLGTSFQSIELVDTRILRSLGRLRLTLSQYVSGDGGVAARLWLSAPRDIYTDPGGATLDLTVDQITCLEDLAKTVKTAVQEPSAAPPAVSGPVTSPAAGGASPAASPAAGSTPAAESTPAAGSTTTPGTPTTSIPVQPPRPQGASE